VDPNKPNIGTYYLVGSINKGSDTYRGKDYPIVDGTATYKFTSDTYIWIMDESGNVYKTDAYVTDSFGTFYKGDNDHKEKMYVHYNKDAIFYLTENRDVQGNLVSLTLSVTYITNHENVVDLNSDEFVKDPNKLYIGTTFYDYYTNYELENKNLDNRKETFSDASHYYQFGTFNKALSSFYAEQGKYVSASKVVPIYVGHFQPDWGSWGAPFSGLHINLYGYKDGKAYGTSNQDQKWFMSVNNSTMNVANNPTEGHTHFASWGIVADKLNNDNNLLNLLMNQNNKQI
jgi:hypothetical protein